MASGVFVPEFIGFRFGLTDKERSAADAAAEHEWIQDESRACQLRRVR
jgi:hypothetical protein